MQSPKVKFPKRFLWGAATAAHQVEGGNHNQWSIWELENATALAKQARYKLSELPEWNSIAKQASSPSNYVSAKAVDHYSRYEEDFDLLQKMNFNAFRFSIEWSRIEPKEGEWNKEVVEHYRKYIAALKKRQIEPVMTLLHFTLPDWFASKGGFEKRRNIKYFLRYVRYIVTEIGGGVRYIVTLNEPEIYATQSYLTADWPPQKHKKWLWIQVINNQITAHNRAAKIIHAIRRGHKVSIAKNSAYYYPGDMSKLTRLTTVLMQTMQDDYFLKRVIRHCDFVGVNYYFSNRIYGTQIHNPNHDLSDLGWDMHPEDIQFALERLYQKYKKPILITENGLADMSDKKRKWWLAKTIVAMSEAMKHGVKLEGYLHWSLLDNFEWAYGKWPRFGLVAVDYKTMERTLRPSAKWFATIVKKLRKDSNNA